MSLFINFLFLIKKPHTILNLKANKTAVFTAAAWPKTTHVSKKKLLKNQKQRNTKETKMSWFNSILNPAPPVRLNTTFTSINPSASNYQYQPAAVAINTAPQCSEYMRQLEAQVDKVFNTSNLHQYSNRNYIRATVINLLQQNRQMSFCASDFGVKSVVWNPSQKAWFSVG